MDETKDETRNFLLRKLQEKKHEMHLTKDTKWYLRKRYVITMLVFLGMLCMMLLRLNLSIVIIEMTSPKLMIDGNRTIVKEAEFTMNSKEKGVLLSLFGYGYCVGPLGGFLATKYGAAKIFGLGIGLTALLTIISPLAIHANIFIYGTIRILEGVFESFSMVSIAQIIYHWSSPNELCRLLLIPFAGAAIGSALSYPLSGIVAYKFGWEMIFYTTGGISLIWFVVWYKLVKDDPCDDKYITEIERDYLKSVQQNVSKEKIISYPWIKILTSGPVWALLNDFFSLSLNVVLVTACLPLFIKDVYKATIDDVGILAGIVCFSEAVGIITWSFFGDYLRKSNLLRIPTIHKLFIFIGQSSSAILLIVIGLWTDFQQSLIALCLMKFLFGSAETAYQVLFVDMFGPYTSLIRGIGVSVFSLGSLFCPTVMGFIVTDHSRSSWNIFFLFLSFFNIWSIGVFFLFGSGKPQPWAFEPVRKETEII